METRPLKKRRVGDRRSVPDRRRVERRVQGERRNPQSPLMPVDLKIVVRGLDRRIIYRRTIIVRRTFENRRVAASW